MMTDKECLDFFYNFRGFGPASNTVDENQKVIDDYKEKIWLEWIC